MENVLMNENNRYKLALIKMNSDSTVTIKDVPANLGKKIIRRAFNTWDNAPREAKEIADLIDAGEILQEYR